MPMIFDHRNPNDVRQYFAESGHWVSLPGIASVPIDNPPAELGIYPAGEDVEPILAEGECVLLRERRIVDGKSVMVSVVGQAQDSGTDIADIGSGAVVVDPLEPPEEPATVTITQEVWDGLQIELNIIRGAIQALNLAVGISGEIPADKEVIDVAPVEVVIP